MSRPAGGPGRAALQFVENGLELAGVRLVPFVVKQHVADEVDHVPVQAAPGTIALEPSVFGVEGE